MEEIFYNKDRLLNLEFSLNREVLRANMSNAYACTTLVGCNTRKYHGLLIVPQPKIDDSNHVLLSSLDETIEQNGKDFHLSLHCYKNRVFYPKGHKYLESYSLKNLPTTVYRVGDTVISRQILVQEKRDRVLIRYFVEQCSSKFKLKLQPFLAFRQIHRLSKKNSEANTNFEPVLNGVSYQMYENYTPLYIQFSRKVQYDHAPDWYYDFYYQKEEERGYDCLEDLLVPGTFSIELQAGNEFYVACGTEQGNPYLFSRDFKREESTRFPIKTMEDVLKRAAKMFFCRKGMNVNVVAGFPWFGRWGRDTFVSLPGLCYILEDYPLLLKAVDTMLIDFQDGLFPNIGTGEKSSYNSADAPLLFFWTLQQYVEFTGEKEKIWKKYGKTMKNILQTFEDGTENIRMDSNYLLWQGEEGKALTWMDAIVNGKPVTQRKGYAVEINCLWYNAVMFTRSLAEEFCDDEFFNHWDEFSIHFPAEFKRTFWSKDLGYLADCVDENGKDFSVRPNMILACSLNYSPISEKIRQLVVEKVKDELLSPRGLCSLSPKDVKYRGHYYGDQAQRDKAYHNGTVWPWLIGAFAEAYLRTYGRSAVNYVENTIYKGFEGILCDYCVGSIAEIYDADPPFTPNGSISQAWSVAEVCRIRYLIKKYSSL